MVHVPYLFRTITVDQLVYPIHYETNAQLLYAYSFVLTCSPRSPISNLTIAKQNGEASTRSLGWMHLPLPHSAWVMNTFMIGVGVVMVVYNVIITVLNGRQRQLTRAPGHNIFDAVLIQHHTQEWLASAPTPESLDFVKVAWCDMANIYRLCCAALASYIVLIVLVIAMLVLYAIPNQIFLMDNLVAIYPDPHFEQPSKRSAFHLARALWHIGLPKHLHGSSYVAFKKTWMMVMVGHSQMFLILAALFAFSVPPLYLFVGPWKRVWGGTSPAPDVTFIVAFCITTALLTAAWVTAVAGVLTFDDVFRAVSGIGVTRMDETPPTHSLGLMRTFRQALSPVPASPRPARAAQTESAARPTLRYSTSTGSHKSEKRSIANHPQRGKDNTITVSIETCVWVDREDDLETLVNTHAYPPSTSSAPFSYLGRSRSENQQSPSSSSAPFSFLSRARSASLQSDAQA
ncbi:hypothetical protein PSEUBRA_006132 [Kalmanozyma brasiliensis GHG001]|uniref:uncharacterized protein n=1 Tax=Kalmanozyma brasiliensis (strain GHG001) TaxID=1365824 RepID=UPI001CE7F60A|nr:uncharacterized protein PSEUBRA_006132 [Kalmanozyma brasiliensis GHG001]EST04825.2 hypothetical protein PSEUBRA_006132 [Kalmanozyma brasiliensis GHG001]